MNKPKPEPDQTPWVQTLFLSAQLHTCKWRIEAYAKLTGDTKTAQEFERLRLRMLYRLAHPSPARPSQPAAQSQISLFPEGIPTP